MSAFSEGLIYAEVTIKLWNIVVKKGHKLTFFVWMIYVDFIVSGMEIVWFYVKIRNITSFDCADEIEKNIQNYFDL